MSEGRPEELDAAALGLKRRPHGALMLLLFAIAVGGVAVTGLDRHPEEFPAVPPPPEPQAAEVTAPPVAKRQPKKQTVRRKEKPSPQLPVAAASVKEAQPDASPPPLAAKEARLDAPPPPLAAKEAPVEEPLQVKDVPPDPAEEQAEAPSTVARLRDAEPDESEPPPAPPAPEPEPEVDGNGAAIARAIAAAKRAAVRACFEHELKQAPKLAGTVVVELDLAPPNRVEDVRVSDDLQRPSFTRCVAATMRDVRFAALDEEVSVRVPYALTPAAK